MSRFLLRRILLGLLTLLLVSIVVFAATQALPGNAARAILGRNATPARLAALANSCIWTGRCSRSTSGGWATSSPGTSGISAATSSRSSQLIGGRILNSGFLVLLRR